MKFNISPFGWGITSPEVKHDVDSEAVAAQFDALRISMNGITTALDNLPDRIVAEIQVNDPKEDLPLTHPLRLDLDASIARLTHTQARLAATTATLDATAASLYKAETQLRTTTARLDEKENDYHHLEQVNRKITDTLQQTNDECVNLRSANEVLSKELDSLRQKVSSAARNTQDTDSSESSSSQMGFSSLFAFPNPLTPAPTMDKHTLLRHFTQLNYDISQITINPALCISQNKLPPSSLIPEPDPLYDIIHWTSVHDQGHWTNLYSPVHWASLSPTLRELRIRGAIFAFLARYFLPGSAFDLGIAYNWTDKRTSAQNRLDEFERMMRDAGVLEVLIAPIRRMTIDTAMSDSTAVVDNGQVANTYLAMSLLSLLRPMFSPYSTDHEKDSLSFTLSELCQTAYNLGRILHASGDRYTVTIPEVYGQVSTTSFKVVGVEGPALDADEAGVVYVTVFGGMAMKGQNGKVKVLQKAEVIAGIPVWLC